MLAKKRILIVGAGPTGLTLANTLSRFGVGYDIIEAKEQMSNTSKGLAINVSSQIVFSILGINNKVGVLGEHVNKLCLFNNDEKIMRCNLQYLPGQRHMLTQSQATTEQELFECLGENKSAIKWGKKLESIKKNKNGYTASFACQNSRTETEDYDYIIGCEGKNSIVRESIGAKFEGHDYPLYFLLGDYLLDEEVSPGEAKYISFDGKFFITIPIGEKKYRFVGVIDKKIESHKEISDLLADTVNQYFNTNLIKHEATWTSSAKIYLRIADKLKRDRLFICGDAAHLVSPIGGTGMNMGIQDAFNLGCKLASVIKGYQTERLLDNYESERLEVIKSTCMRVDATTRMIFDMDYRKQNQQIFQPTMAKRKYISSELPMAYSGLAMRYPCSNVEKFDKSYSEKFFGRLYLVIQDLYEESLLKDIKPTIIYTLSGGIGVEDNEMACVNGLSKHIQMMYPGVFNQLFSNSSGIYAQENGLITVSSMDSELPKQSVFLINMEGIIKYGCPLKQMDSMQAYINENYLKQ